MESSRRSKQIPLGHLEVCVLSNGGTRITQALTVKWLLSKCDVKMARYWPHRVGGGVEVRLYRYVRTQSVRVF